MQIVERRVGDKAWCFVGNHSGELSQGTVVHKFHLINRYPGDFYVIEIDTHIDPIYEVRTGLSVSDAQDKPIGMWRR